MLPALLFGAALDGHSAWFHAHGEHGVHVHVTPGGESHDGAAEFAASDDLAAWHGAQHEEGEPHDSAPSEGWMVALPDIAVLSRVGSYASFGSDHALALRLQTPSMLQVDDVAHRPRIASASSPPRPQPRSGVVAVLCASHALLI